MAKKSTNNSTANAAGLGDNYEMGKILVEGEAAPVNVLDEYAEEVDDETESQAKAARRRLSENTEDDVLAGNPRDTDDFTADEKFDADEDWPLD